MNDDLRSGIVMRSVLNLIDEEVSDLARIVASFEVEGVLRRFPDGSVYLTTWEAFVRFWAVFEGLGGLISQGGYRSLGAFAPDWFGLVYPRSYWDLLVGSKMSFGCGTAVGPPTPSEFTLQSLALTVGFKRRPGTEVRERYAEMIMDWLASVSERGIFDEGPIGKAAPDVEFQGLRAQVRVDARASGQHTINWFILKALQFGMDIFPKCPMPLIMFAAEETLDRACPAEGKVTKVSLERSGESFHGSREKPATIDESLASRLPSDCTPHSEPGCKLRLFKRPFEDFEDWRFGIYFTVQPNPEHRKRFRQAIKGWRTVAEFGGFGGKSICDFRGLHFDSKTESASFEIDLGHADPRAAVSLLLRILEFFDGAVLAIEAVTFGMEEPGT